eukprot:15364920-Ditylum_brightwellii.AAC.1
MTWYEMRFPRLWRLEWATTMRSTGILAPKLLWRDESLSMVIPDIEVELLPGDVWAQAESWFLGLVVVCCHGVGIDVFLGGLAEEWEDDVSFVATEEKLAKDDASDNARGVGGMQWDELVQIERLFLKQWRMGNLKMPKETVAYCGAGGAPIDVPFSCSQKPSPKEMMLFCIMTWWDCDPCKFILKSFGILDGCRHVLCDDFELVINPNTEWMEKAATVGDDGSRGHLSFVDLGHKIKLWGESLFSSRLQHRYFFSIGVRHSSCLEIHATTLSLTHAK